MKKPPSASQLLARAFRWIDRAGVLYRKRHYAEASRAADRGLELWGESIRAEKRKRTPVQPQGTHTANL